MASEPERAPVRFDEAIRVLRGKVNVPTDTWRDLDAAAHTTGFAVAGVRDLAALQSIRVAVDKALAEGTTLAEFRRDLRGIIERTGITLRGRFGWRSRVIFETNLRTSYAAGRWAQIQRLKAVRPYLRYTAVLDNRTRPQHRAWHGTILPVDHEFWRTHYPPNGWGCRCTVVSLSAADLERRGWAVTDPPPSAGRLPRSVRTADGNRIVELPPGIDEGWDHNVGEAELRARGAATLPGWDAPLTPRQIAPPPELPPLSLLAAATPAFEQARQAARHAAEALLRADADLGAAAAALLPPAVRAAAEAEFAAWAATVLAAGRAAGTARVIGALTQAEVAALREAGREPAAAAITLTEDRLLHLHRDVAVARGAPLPAADLLRLPALIGAREALLLDLLTGALLHVLVPLDAEERRRRRIVLRADAAGRGAGVVTAEAVELAALADASRYRVISGGV
jgi:SPP1 gp7 family putative phage head morphogenesis protein